MFGTDYVLPVVLGICLAAATGFRVFAPLLVMGLAAREGALPLGDSFSWITTYPALLMLGVAAVVEVGAYYIPVLDNLLDTIATPVAVLCGILVSAAVMTDLPPMLKWTLAIIAGGGAAGLTQTATAVLRGGSTAATGGLANHILSTGEILGAIGLAVVSIFAPYLGLAALAIAALIGWRIIRAWRRRRDAAAPNTPPR